MSKIDEVRSDMVKAMKAGDKGRKDTLSLLLSALKNKAIDKREDLTPEEETQVILKEIKQVKETLDMTPADRTDIIKECTDRLDVLNNYAPKMMDEAEIREVINSVLAETGIDAPSAKDKGKIMKVLMPKVKGKADGKLVNEIFAIKAKGAVFTDSPRIDTFYTVMKVSSHRSVLLPSPHTGYSTAKAAPHSLSSDPGSIRNPSSL